MSREERKLARELRAIGVAEPEVGELTQAAEQLSSLRLPGLSPAARQRIASRLPVDVEPEEAAPRRLPAIRWVAAGSLALLAVIVGTVLLWPNHAAQKPASRTASQAPQPKQPDTTEQLLQEHADQLKQLQQQPVVNQQEVQKTKDDFQQEYNQYQQSHANDKNFTNSWSNYQSQWWWQAVTSPTQSTQQSGGRQTAAPHVNVPVTPSGGTSHATSR